MERVDFYARGRQETFGGLIATLAGNELQQIVSSRARTSLLSGCWGYAA